MQHAERKHGRTYCALTQLVNLQQLMARQGWPFRGVKTDADTTYSCPQLYNEPTWRTLQRKLVVGLAGPAWEAFGEIEDHGCKESATP